MIIGDVLLLCEAMGFRKSLKWIFRAFRYGISGKLDKDNEELFVK